MDWFLSLLFWAMIGVVGLIVLGLVLQLLVWLGIIEDPMENRKWTGWDYRSRCMSCRRTIRYYDRHHGSFPCGWCGGEYERVTMYFDGSDWLDNQNPPAGQSKAIRRGKP